MFGKSRLEILEENHIRQLEREERTFRLIMDSLDQIKQELHTITSKMISNQSDLDLKIIKTKEDILNHVSESKVNKEEFEHQIREIQKEINNIKQTLNEKVAKSSVRLSWFIITSIIGVVMWFISTLGTLKGG